MRPIATDTADFPKLRARGCIYVDKTMFMHRMVTDLNTSLFFISRPRRFGKSLTLSALKALFSGRRELFDGLYIGGTDWNWEKYPVIHFEFNDVTTTSIADFETSFAEHVRERLEKAGFAYDKALPPPENFGNAIESLSA
ncbi:MAG: AAA family ATPase, partial [Kiritimatiellae bacterium]|nr:AAA family ATPase [Kiritimatiellia bacterium]